MNKFLFTTNTKETSGLDANLISRQYKLNLMADFFAC